MSSASLISIVLPVHNQADHVEKLIDGYVRDLEKVPFQTEFILVANACTDNTPAVCEQLGKKYPNVKTIVTERGGWGLSVKLGIKAATGDLICYTNSARTTPEILTLFLMYSSTYPNVVVKANRKIRESIRRRLGSLLYNIECRALFDLATWDINGTPKVFPREFKNLLDLTREDDLIDAEFLATCRNNDYPILEIPIFSTKRHSGKSTTNYMSAVKMYTGALQLWKTLQGRAL